MFSIRALKFKGDVKINIKEYEISMWEAAKNRDGAGFMELVDENAVMVCGGYRCTGAEYGEIVKDFDIASFEISAFECFMSPFLSGPKFGSTCLFNALHRS